MSQDDFDRDHRRTLRRGRTELMTAFHRDPNVTGMAVGYRSRGGEHTDEPVVIATVAKKRKEGYVARERLLPRHVDIDGKKYGVDVIEAGPFHASAGPFDGDVVVRDEANANWVPPVPISERFRPAPQGCDIANVARAAYGTLGTVVRDRSDGTLCILSSNHVLANFNQTFPGTQIVQPIADSDPDAVIANLKRYIPLSFDRNNPTTVDAAIAQVIDPALVSKNVALGLMPPISSSHPAVGMVVARDSWANALVCDIGETLRQLNVELLPDNAVRQATWGMHVEKVGRATRHTASLVTGLDLLAQIYHDYPGHPDSYWITDGTLVPNFSWAGDFGAVVCAGGNADRPVYIIRVNCFVIPVVPDMYDLPDTATPEFGDRIRDEFLALTHVGRLLTQVLYLNADTVTSRTEGVEASDDEKAYANMLYARWRDYMEAALDDPDDPQYVVSDQHLRDTNDALFGFSLRATPEETDAAAALYDQVLTRTLGMNYRQLLAFMNDPSVYRQVYDIIAAVPNVVMREPMTI